SRAEEDERGVGVRGIPRLRGPLVAPRGAVLPIAVGREARGMPEDAQAPDGVADAQADAAGVVAAGPEIEPGRRFGRRVLGVHRDHAARGVAVERRERAAQHLDALGRAEIDAGCLALAVGARERNAVDQQAHAAYAEGRARAE